jgi:uncharacterized membrane protein YhaH (DUF805 family)
MGMTAIDSRTQTERDSAYVYWWLFWSPVVTVLWMIIAITATDMSSRSQANWVMPVLLSGLPHLVLLFGLRSKHLYQRRHTQQALLLAAIRVVSSVLFVGVMRNQGVCLWILINGSLWLGSSMWGLGQVRRGECWLMTVMGDDETLPRPWALPTKPAPTATPAQPASGFEPSPIPRTLLIRGQELVQSGQPAEAIVCFISVFRNGSPELRRQAVNALEQMGEIEVF